MIRADFTISLYPNATNPNLATVQYGPFEVGTIEDHGDGYDRYQAKRLAGDRSRFFTDLACAVAYLAALSRASHNGDEVT